MAESKRLRIKIRLQRVAFFRLMPLGVFLYSLTLALQCRAERFNFLQFLPSQGISQSQVTSILQDKQGFLWLGTLTGGLNRYDGQQFKPYRWPQGLGSAHVRNLLEVGDTLYVGTRHGLFRKEGDQFVAIPGADGTIHDVYGLTSTPEGHVIVAANSGLYQVIDNTLQLDPRSSQLPGPKIFDVVADSHHGIWVYHRSWLGTLQGNIFTEIPLPKGIDLLTLTLDKRGGAWIGTRQGLYHSDGRSFAPHQALHPLLQKPVSALYVDSRRWIWVGTREGAVGFKDKQIKVLDGRSKFPMVRILAILEDRERNLFFGTDGEGLIQLTPQPFTSYTIDGVADYAPTAMIEDGTGGRIVSTLGQGIILINKRGTHHVGADQGLSNPDCTSILLRKGTDLWVGTNSGLFRFDPTEEKPSVHLVEQVGEVPVNALLQIDQTIYIATEDGLWRYADDTWTQFTMATGLPGDILYGMYALDQDRLWIGTADAGAFLIDVAHNAVERRLELNDGLPSRTVWSIHRDSHGILWLGTDQGLVQLLDTGLNVITSKDGLPNDTVNFISEDPTNGILWVGTNRGIAALVNNQWRSYTYRHGLPSDETNTNAVKWDSEGRLWAGTSHGYALLTSSPPPVSPVPPLIHLEKVLEHDKSIDFDSSPTFEFDHNRLRFQYVGLSYLDPGGINYRYRLGGLEDDWITTTQREIRYPALPPGSYIFEIDALTSDGRKSIDPRRFSFTIKPPYWQTWWFQTLEIATIFVCGMLFYGIRAAHLIQQKKKLEMLITERTRELKVEKEKSERLLLNILPAPIADELKERGVASTRLFHDVTILFTDFQGFTKTCADIDPERLVNELNEVFAVFDDICRAHRLEKLKTIGDAFMAAAGLPLENTTHPIDAVEAAIEMRDYLKTRRGDASKIPFHLRIGINTGPVVAGVIGKWKFAYDIWGDAVNIASRMESSGEVGEINISRASYERVWTVFDCESRGHIQAKGKGKLEMFFVRDYRASPPSAGQQRELLE